MYFSLIYISKQFQMTEKHLQMVGTCMTNVSVYQNPFCLYMQTIRQGKELIDIVPYNITHLLRRMREIRVEYNVNLLL